jgi:hypothetical protein
VDLGIAESASERLEGYVDAEHLTWEERAFGDEALFTSGLHDLGLPDSKIAEAWSAFSEMSKPLDRVDDQIRDFQERDTALHYQTPEELLRLYEKRRSTLERILDQFKAQTFRIDSTTQSKLRIPVLILSAPAVEGCSISFTTSTQLDRNLSFRLTVYGSGTGGATKASCKAQCEFIVNDGNAKVVFLPAELTVGEVSVLAKGEVIGQGPQIQTIDFPDADPAVTLIPRGAYPAAGALIKTYPLAGDTTGDVSTYRYDYNKYDNIGFSLKTQAFGLDVGLQVEVALLRTVGLTYTLKGGHDYSLHHVDEGVGITWNLSD